MSPSGQNRYFSQKCSSFFFFFLELFGSLAFEGRQEGCSKEWLRLEKGTSPASIICIDRRTSFRVCHAESTGENGDRHSDSGGEGSVIRSWNRVKQLSH